MAYLGRRWIIGFALFGLLLVAVAVAVASGSEGPSERELPDGCDVLYKTLSPDGRFLAYVGGYTDDTGTKQYGLFVIENGSREVRRLLETAVKTVPAWSPDSRRLAIGNSPGYGNRYPLVILDVPSGEVSETGVQGVGAAWSPDGRFIAVSTEIVRGGNWSHGIPIDGRIGVWDVEKKKLSPVTPPGYNIEDDIGGNYGMGGSFDPVWSPDGRWIAYRRITVFIEGKRDERSDEIWIADREGREFRKAFEGSKKVCWSADGKSLSVAGGDPPQQVELSRLEAVAAAAMSGPPPALLDAAQRASAARERAKDFDAAPLFRRNLPWQNPDLKHLQSIEFTHHMEPIVLDERFVWRSDGASLMEVVARDDDKAAKEVGRRVITTPATMKYYRAPPEAMKYYRTPGAKYYTGSAIGESGLNNYVRNHLMGTQTNFTALDWGRNPGGFAVRDVQPGSDKDTVVVDLKPTVRRYQINFGAMFHTTSWAYMHDLRVGHSEITVDVRNHRILSEVDYNYQGGKICQVDFLDWQDVDNEHSVPKHIHIDIPGSNFEVDYRFQWLPEKLWILSSGQACFNKKNPQCEELRDLKINQPTPDLDAALAEVAQNQKELEGGDAIQPEKRLFALYPFQLGKRMQLDAGTAKDAEPRVREVFFTIGEQDNLLVRFDVAGIDEKNQAAENGNGPHQLYLVLFDESGQPVSTFAVSAAESKDGKITLDLGKSRVLSMVKFWSVGGLGHVPPPTGTKKLEAAVWPCRDDEKLIVDVPAQANGFGPYVDASGKTQIRSVRLQKGENGDLTANLEIVSRDHLKELNAVAAVVLLDENNSVVAAATGDLTFRVRGEIYNSSDFVLKLGQPPQTQSPKYLLLGLKTIHIGGPMGSLWGRYYGRSPLFSFEQMLAAEDAGVWSLGLKLLDDHLHREVMPREFLDEEIGVHREPTRATTLRPHLQRFEHFFKVGEDAEALAVLCRLAGHSGDKRFVAIMLPLLQHKSETVQDAAAIGLGLLGNSAGRKRLELIQNLPAPTDRDKYAAVGYWRMDADFAMKEIEKNK